MPITLPCDTDADDTLTLARLGGCAALTVRARQHQVNLTPADAREAARWLLACAEEIETSLARVRASQGDPPSPSRIDSAAPSGGLGGSRGGGLATTTALTIEGPLNASAEVVL